MATPLRRQTASGYKYVHSKEVDKNRFTVPIGGHMASIVKRIWRIIVAWFNDLIDKVEDPDRLVKASILEIEEKIRTARNGVVDAVAGEKELAMSLDHQNKLSAKCMDRAEDALRAGNEDEAKAILMEKHGHDRMARDIEAALEIARKTTRDLRTRLGTLENELERLRIRRSTLAARSRAAEARGQMAETMGMIRGDAAITDNMDRMEDRLMEAETRAEVLRELAVDASPLQAELDHLAVDAETEVESEMDSIRKRLMEAGPGHKRE